MKISVKLGKIIDEYGLEVVYAPEGCREREISVADVNRPSLQIAGFFDYFDPARLLVFGKVEYTYVE
jgi:HPr kinase/phosphorylase